MAPFLKKSGGRPTGRLNRSVGGGRKDLQQNASRRGTTPLAFLAIGPSFTPQSLNLAYHYKARTNPGYRSRQFGRGGGVQGPAIQVRPNYARLRRLTGLRADVAAVNAGQSSLEQQKKVRRSLDDYVAQLEARDDERLCRAIGDYRQYRAGHISSRIG